MYIPRVRRFWSVSIGHFTNDVFMSSGVVLLTFLSSSILPMTNTQIGLAVSAQQLLGALSQPFFGLRADKTGGRLLGSGGLVWVVSMFLLAVLLAVTTQNYVLMLIPFVLQGIGSGALHPVGAMHAAEADKERVATNTSYFFLMGQLGLALGPSLVGFLLDWANRDSLLPYTHLLGFQGNIGEVQVFPIFLMGLAAIPSMVLMYRGIPSSHTPHQKKAKNPEDADSQGLSWAVLSPFLIIGLMVLLRSLAQPGSVNFIPVLFHEKGWSTAHYGMITSSFWLSSAIFGVFFGNLADKYDRRLIVMVSMVLSAPAFFFLPIADGVLAVVLAIAAGGLSGGAHSILIVLAQELIPHSKAFASGAILGFIFGTGALGSLLIGTLADNIGLATTFQWVALAALAAGFMGLLLPKRQ